MATKYRSPGDLYIPSLGKHVTKGEVFESDQKLTAPFERVTAKTTKAKTDKPASKRTRKSKGAAVSAGSEAMVGDKGPEQILPPTTDSQE